MSETALDGLEAAALLNEVGVALVRVMCRLGTDPTIDAEVKAAIPLINRIMDDARGLANERG